jgi:hypothetical protein
MISELIGPSAGKCAVIRRKKASRRFFSGLSTANSCQVARCQAAVRYAGWVRACIWARMPL